ncbi:MAG: hypothetical protein PHQ23_13945 [Candidatus Wallbacteria bacterium]|nr:hypothetical protein [Candidatus Wallbacteria bacterium]
MTPREKANEFLKIAHLFRLGTIPTENPHPRTADMSHLAVKDPSAAVSMIKSLDMDLFPVLRQRLPELGKMRSDILETLQSGGRIFLSGCGSTGRLSLFLEYFWRREVKNLEWIDSVIGLMAGGDSAVVKAVEKFEDFPEYGARQMEQLGFRDGDLLLASTEGGETPFVIGTAEYAAQKSFRKPYFLYCNPDESLMPIERSRLVIENPGIVKVSLFVSHQALSGSTRMQASSILTAAIGLCLHAINSGYSPADGLGLLEETVRKTDFEFLEEFIRLEADTYRQGDYVLYETNDYGMTLFTDSTERSPTFSLMPFENRLDRPLVPSLSYMSFPECRNAGQAWERLFARQPRPLDWEGMPAVSREYLQGFDFSCQAAEFREKLVAPAKMHRFSILRHENDMVWTFRGCSHSLRVGTLPMIVEHILLKLMLNIHSTLVMGRFGRYMDNIMIYVRPSNNKLIDRAIRYIILLLKARGSDISYEDCCYHLYEVMESLKPDEPVVLLTLNRILEEKGMERAKIGEKGESA